MGSMDFPPSVENTELSVTQEPLAWYDVWMEVITHPSRDSFRRILADPTAGPARAFIWVAAIGLIVGLMQIALTEFLGISPLSEIGEGGLMFGVICISIGAPLGAVIGLALNAAIMRGIAGLLKGAGNFNDLVYCLGALQAPVSIVASLISLISLAVSGGGEELVSGGSRSIFTLCLLPFSLAIGIYTIVLQVLAVGTVEKFGTGKAVLTVLMPAIIGILLGVCLAAALIPIAANQY